MMIEMHVLMVLMIVGALVALETKDLLSSVVALGAVGLVQSLSFLVLKAPDLAIVQLVVEILSLVILLRATMRRDTVGIGGRAGYWGLAVGIACVLVLLACTWRSFAGLPPFGSPKMAMADFYVSNGPQTGAANIVSTIVMDFRALDTLGEAAVLFTAVIGAIAVLRKTGRKRAGPEPGKEPK